MSGRGAESFGQHGVTWVDRLGVWLSQRAIDRSLPSGNDLRVLELGCGYRATHLMALSGRLKEGTGVDFHVAPELLSAPGFTFHEGSIEDTLPTLEPETFDVLLLISILEHLHERSATLEAAHRLLRPGGVLIVSVPTWRGKYFLELSAFRLGLSPKVEMDDHKMYFDKRDLWPLLVNAGFRPSEIRLSYYKFGLNLFASVVKTADA